MTNATHEKTQRIQVSNLGVAATEVQVRALFLKHGEIAAFSRPVDNRTGRPGAIAYLEMSATDATKAIHALNGFRLEGVALDVRNASPEARWTSQTNRSAVSPRPRRTVTPELSGRRSSSTTPTEPAVAE